MEYPTKNMTSKTPDRFKHLLNILNKYEERVAPKTFPSGNPRTSHWYKLELYSDGSGKVMDSNLDKTKFSFHDIGRLEDKLIGKKLNTIKIDKYTLESDGKQPNQYWVYNEKEEEVGYIRLSCQSIIANTYDHTTVYSIYPGEETLNKKENSLYLNLSDCVTAIDKYLNSKL